MTQLNVLITSMGSTTSIGIAKMIRGSGYNTQIIGTDINQHDRIAGSAFCNQFFTVPVSSDPAYLPRLKEIVKENKISIIIPVHDKEIECLSLNIEDFRSLGCIVMASTVNTVKQVNDKFLFARVLQQNGISVPLTFSLAEWKVANKNYKENGWVLKPNDGVSSRGIVFGNEEVINDYIERKNIKDGYIIQEFIKGEEFTVDTFIKDKNVVCVIPRRRAEVREGLCYKAYTLPNTDFLNPVKAIADLFDFLGPINIQFLKDEITNELYCLECNPRFGGTSILSFYAGVNLYDLIVKYYLGEGLPFIDKYKYVFMTRYWEEQCYEL